MKNICFVFKCKKVQLLFFVALFWFMLMISPNAQNISYNDIIGNMPYAEYTRSFNTYKDIVDAYYDNDLTATKYYTDFNYNITLDQLKTVMPEFYASSENMGTFTFDGVEYQAYRTYDTSFGESYAKYYFFNKSTGFLVVDAKELLDLTVMAYAFEAKNIGSIKTAREELLPALKELKNGMIISDIVDEVTSMAMKTTGAVTSAFITGGLSSATPVSEIMKFAGNNFVKQITDSDILAFASNLLKLVAEIEKSIFWFAIENFDIANTVLERMENNPANLRTQQGAFDYFKHAQIFNSHAANCMGMLGPMAEQCDSISDALVDKALDFGEGFISGFAVAVDIAENAKDAAKLKELCVGEDMAKILSALIKFEEGVLSFSDIISEEYDIYKLSKVIEAGIESTKDARLTSFDALATTSIMASNAIFWKVNIEIEYAPDENVSKFNSKLSTFRTTRYGHDSTYVNDPANTGGYQCFGFANELAKYIFGSYPTSSMSATSVNSDWTRTYGGIAIDNLHIGDIVRYWNHSIFITGISGDTITYCQANVPSGTNKVTYDNTISRSTLKSRVSSMLTHDGATTTGWVAHHNSWGDSLPITPQIDSRYPTPFFAYTLNGTTDNVYSSIGGTSSYGRVDYDDLCTITAVYENGWALVSYPLDSGGAKSAYMPLTEFIAKGFTPTKTTATKQSTTYTKSDMATEFGYVASGDVIVKVGAVEAGNTAYVQVIYPVSNGYKLAWTILDDIHTHSYTWGYEGDHPHREYMKCSCGDYYYTGENYFDEAYYISYFAAHPHYEVRVCNICGWDHTEQTGATVYLDSCEICTAPDMPVISISKTAWSEDETITFSWQACTNADYYYPMVYDSAGERVDVCWGTPERSRSVNLAAGTYRLQVASVNDSTKVETYSSQKTITVSEKYYAVKFNANGGTWPQGNLTKRHNVNITIPNVWPSRTGYTFKGWSTGLNGAVAYYGGSTYSANSDVTLYAVWQANTYTVTYNANGGSGSMSASSHTYDAAKTLNANAYKKKGYNFKGWATSEISASVAYSDKQSVTNLSSVNGANVTLYAIWEPKIVTVNFDPFFGTVDTKSKQVVFDQPYGELPVPVLTGFTFKGWMISFINEVYIDSTTIVSDDAEHTLTAGWKANVYTVKFDANGGNGTMSDMQCGYDSTYNFPTNTFTKTGYLFNGWNTKADGSGDSRNNNSQFTKLASEDGAVVTFYAQWEPIIYTVAYNSNGGVGNMSTISHTYDVEKNLSINTYKRAGYHFKGWATSPSATKATYTDGQSVINLTSTYYANVNLYAVWEVAVNGIKFDENSIILEPTDIGTIKATVLPENAANKNITWESEDESIATVIDGKVYPKNIGDTVIRAITEDGGFVAECAVTVKIKVKSVTLNKNMLTLNSQDSEQLYATVLPDNATNKGITWSTSNDLVATVSEDGTVTAQSKGTAVITAMGDDGKKASCNLNVTAYVTGVSLDKTDITVMKDDRFIINASIAPFNASNKRTIWSISDEYDFETSRYSDRIYLTPKYLGTYTVTITTEEGGFTDTCTIKVIDGGYNWTYDAETTTLTISGNMSNYGLYDYAPWYEYHSECTNIVFSDDITSIGSYAFTGFSKVKSIKLPKKLTNINQHAFEGCYDLVNLEVPATVTTIENNNFDNYEFANIYYTGTEEQYANMYVSSIGNTYFKKATIHYASMASDINITYDSNGGTWISTPKGHLADVPISEEIPTKDGYTFLGWSDKESGKAKYNAGDMYNGTEDITLYAVWKIKTYTVKYDANGGQFIGRYDSQIKEHGKALTLNYPLAVRDGYRLAYWITSTDGLGEGYSETMDPDYYGNKDITLYAVWDKVETSATVSLNTTDTTLNIGDTFQLIATVSPSRGYQVKWSSSDSNIVTVSANGVITAKNRGTAIIEAYVDTYVSAYCAVEVYADVVMITYNANGGENAPAEQTKLVGKDIALSYKTPTRDEHAFLGWSTSPDGDVEYYPYNRFSADEHTTLYAKWTQEPCTEVVFWCGSRYEFTIAKINGSVLYLEQVIPYEIGYTQNGWISMESDGFKLYEMNGCLTEDKDYDLLARTSANKYTVYFEVCGGDMSVNSMSVTYGSEYGDLPTPTREGYEFNGWYTAENSGEVITSETEMLVAENHIIYAQWTQVDFKGDIDKDGTIDILDCLVILSTVLNDEPLENADLNDDGNISLIDVIRALKLCVN